MSAPTLAGGVRFRRNADGQGVLLIPEGVVNLNESAAAIIELVNGERSVAAIACDLSARYGIDQAEMASDVDDLLQRLAAKTWLVLGGSLKR